MKIVIFGNNKESQELLDLTKSSLVDLGLDEFVLVESNDSDEYKNELQITKIPAFCLEEENLEFKDIIFEGELPSKDELSSLLMTIIGGNSDGCGGSCSGCGGSCAH